MAFLVQSLFKYMVPMMLVALAGVFAERSGIINIALDGMMIFGSFIGALFVYILQADKYGIQLAIENGHGQLIFLAAMLIAAVAGGLFSLLLAFSAINLKADQTIGGTALNLLAPAISLFFIDMICSQQYMNMPYGTTNWFLVRNEGLQGTIGEWFFDRMYISTYIAFALFILLALWLYKTKTGLRLRSCGEHPQAADSVGISVKKMRYLGTTISGMLGGLGGYIYVVCSANGAVQGDVQGVGFIALAIMIFGNWKPGGIALGAFLFGLLRCISATYAQLDINGDGVCLLANLGLPGYFYNILPYVAVLIVLIFTAGKSRCPKAEGIPYDKGQR